jgi:hypothetical protein
MTCCAQRYIVVRKFSLVTGDRPFLQRPTGNRQQAPCFQDTDGLHKLQKAFESMLPVDQHQEVVLEPKIMQLHVYRKDRLLTRGYHGKNKYQSGAHTTSLCYVEAWWSCCTIRQSALIANEVLCWR